MIIWRNAAFSNQFLKSNLLSILKLCWLDSVLLYVENLDLAGKLWCYVCGVFWSLISGQHKEGCVIVMLWSLKWTAISLDQNKFLTVSDMIFMKSECDLGTVCWNPWEVMLLNVQLFRDVILFRWFSNSINMVSHLIRLESP